MAAVKTRNTATLMTEGSIVKSLLLFALPLIFGNLLQQMYNTADSIIVGNFVGSNALAAVGSSGSPIYLLIGFSQGLAVGAGVVVSQYLGAGDHRETREAVHTALAIAVVMGLLLTVGGVACGRALLVAMNTPAEVLADAVTYIRIYFGGVLFSVVYNMTAGILNAAGNSRRSLVYLAWASVTNIVLDYLFIAVFRWGIGGAAVATGLGYSITAIVGLLVFSNRNSLLHFVRPVCRPQTLGRAVTNGCSEMATALVNGIITLMFNWTMLKYVGEDGVAAITIISYVLAFAGSLYAGYAYGVAPMLSFYYGEQNHEKLRKLVRTSLKIIGAVAAATVLVSLAVTEPLVSIFARPGTPVYDLAVAGNRICSLALLFVGFNIFASGMFTALSNGLISAVLAFSRTFVFTLIAMLVLPVILGVTGIWLATPAAELAAVVLSAVMLLKYRRRYCY